MHFTTIVAAFLSQPAGPNLRERAIAAGVTDVVPLEPGNRRALGFHDPARELVGGTWGAFGMAWAVVDDVEGLECLQIYMSMNSYFDAVVAAMAAQATGDDPMLAHIETFRDACLRLEPRAAFLDTRSHYGDETWEDKQGNRGWVHAQARRVAASDTNALADEHYGLLYLGEALAALWDANPPVDDRERDRFVVPRGRLVFAGSGPTRMA